MPERLVRCRLGRERGCLLFHWFSDGVRLGSLREIDEALQMLPTRRQLSDVLTMTRRSRR